MSLSKLRLRLKSPLPVLQKTPSRQKLRSPRDPRQRGSITALTLFAFALLTGAFIYVAVIGSRAAETTRARTSADATAMAAATVKAKIMNYQSFLLLAESILLPMDKITDSIRRAQIVAGIACIGAGFLNPSIWAYCAKYAPHVAKTNANLSEVKSTVREWLEGLRAASQGLAELGPYWAEYVASQTGMSSSYTSGANGVAVAASYPIPLKLGGFKADKCSDLGLEEVGANDDNGGTDACHGVFGGGLQLLYLAASADPGAIVLDTLGTTLTGNLLVLGGKCRKEVKVPRLRSDWRKFRTSRGMALIENPSDHFFKRYLEWANGAAPPKTLNSGYLLGMGCAEHYSQNHYGEETLWNMDWRARLVPCEYWKSENIQPVERCAIPGPGNVLSAPLKVFKIWEQFNRELLLGISKHWRY